MVGALLVPNWTWSIVVMNESWPHLKPQPAPLGN